MFNVCNIQYIHRRLESSRPINGSFKAQFSFLYLYASGRNTSLHYDDGAQTESSELADSMEEHANSGSSLKRRIVALLALVQAL